MRLMPNEFVADREFVADGAQVQSSAPSPAVIGWPLFVSLTLLLLAYWAVLAVVLAGEGLVRAVRPARADARMRGDMIA